MSAENYIPSAAGAVIEIAKQILAAHGVDLDELFEFNVSADEAGARGEGPDQEQEELASVESPSAIFDVQIEPPEEAIERKTGIDLETGEEKEGVRNEVPLAMAREEYAQDLFDKVGLIQQNIIDYERECRPTGALRTQLDTLYDQLSILGEDISGGSTDMDSLKGYYERFESIRAGGESLPQLASL